MADGSDGAGTASVCTAMAIDIFQMLLGRTATENDIEKMIWKIDCKSPVCA
jgi:hypothetical protein